MVKGLQMLFCFLNQSSVFNLFWRHIMRKKRTRLNAKGLAATAGIGDKRGCCVHRGEPALD